MGPASDRLQPESIPRHVLWAGVAFLAVFPLFAVNTTSSGMRAVWIGFLFMGGFVCFITHLREETDPELHKYAELQRRGPYLRRYRPAVFGIILSVLLVAEILATAATYATPDRPLIWCGTMLIAQWGESIFPLVDKYATQMTPPLGPEILYKVQAVTTLFLTAGAFIFITFTPYVLCMPHEETVVMNQMSDRFDQNRFLSSPTSMLFILVPFGILGGFALFLGWFEFNPDPAYLTHKKCFMKAACYVADDLLLIATGFIRIFGSYGFWLGALMVAIRASASDTE